MKALFIFQKVIIVSIIFASMITAIPMILMIIETLVASEVEGADKGETIFPQLMEALVTSYKDW